MSISPGLFERHIRVDGLTYDDVQACLEVAQDDQHHPERRLTCAMTVLTWVDTQRWLREEAVERHRHDTERDILRLQRKHQGLNLALLDLNAILRCVYLDWIEAKARLDRLVAEHGTLETLAKVEPQPERLGRLRTEPMLPLIDRRRGGTVPADELFVELSRRITTWQAAVTLYHDAQRVLADRYNPKRDALTAKIMGYARLIDGIDVLSLEILREAMAIECAEIYRDMVRRHPIDAWRVAQEHLRNPHGELTDNTLRLWYVQRQSLAERIISDSALTQIAREHDLLDDIAEATLLAGDPFDHDLGV